MEVLLGLIAAALVGYFIYQRVKANKPTSSVSPGGGGVKPDDHAPPSKE